MTKASGEAILPDSDYRLEVNPLQAKRLKLRAGFNSQICGASLAVFLFQKCPFLQFRKRLPQLLLRIHHNRPVPCDRLSQRLAGNQQEADSVVSGLHSNLIAAIKNNE